MSEPCSRGRGGYVCIVHLNRTTSIEQNGSEGPGPTTHTFQGLLPQVAVTWGNHAVVTVICGSPVGRRTLGKILECIFQANFIPNWDWVLQAQAVVMRTTAQQVETSRRASSEARTRSRVKHWCTRVQRHLCFHLRFLSAPNRWAKLFIQTIRLILLKVRALPSWWLELDQQMILLCRSFLYPSGFHWFKENENCFWIFSDVE